jgi:hypothetical protein
MFRSMGPDDGGLLQMAMDSMPVVVRELPSMVDVNETFYASPNKDEADACVKGSLSNLAKSLLELRLTPEDGGVDGVLLIRTCCAGLLNCFTL